MTKLVLACTLALAACGPTAAKEVRSTTTITATVDENDAFLQTLAGVIQQRVGETPDLRVGGSTSHCTGDTELADTLTWACDADRTLQIVYAILDDQLTAHIYATDDARAADLKALSDGWVDEAKAQWAAARP